MSNKVATHLLKDFFDKDEKWLVPDKYWPFYNGLSQSGIACPAFNYLTRTSVHPCALYQWVSAAHTPTAALYTPVKVLRPTKFTQPPAGPEHI